MVCMRRLVFSFTLLEKSKSNFLARPLYTSSENFNWSFVGMDSITFKKGLEAYENLLKEQEQLRRDGLIFIFEHNLWKEFLEWQTKKLYEIQRSP